MTPVLDVLVLPPWSLSLLFLFNLLSLFLDYTFIYFQVQGLISLSFHSSVISILLVSLLSILL